MQSDEGYQKILADELYNVFLKFIQVSRGGRGFTSLVFGMGQLSEEGIAKKIAEQISVIAFKAPRLLHMEKNSPCSGKPPSGHIGRSIRTGSIS